MPQIPSDDNAELEKILNLEELNVESFSMGCLPHTFYQATISVLPKKGKDPLNCSSFRPISLLNVDCKTMAKVLARRLENVLPTILAPDQTGFIKKYI